VCAQRLQKELTKGGGGNATAKGTDRAPVQKADWGQEPCPLQKGVNWVASSNGTHVCGWGVAKAALGLHPLLCDLPFLALLSVWDRNWLKPGLCSKGQAAVVFASREIKASAAVVAA